MIKRLRIKNYKVLRAVDVEFDRLTLVEGRNGSGKTSLLDALQALVAVPTHGTLFAAFGDNTRQLARRTRPGSGPIEIEFEGEWDGGEGRLSLVLEVGPDAPKPRARLVQSWHGHAETQQGHADNDHFHWSAPALARAMSNIRKFRFEPSALRRASSGDLEDNGAGLTGFLLHRRVVDPKSAALVNEALSTVLSNVSALAVTPRAIGSGRYDVAFEMTDGALIAPEDANDATLLVLGYVVALLGADAHTILIDDIDHGLDPETLRRLVTWIANDLPNYRHDLQLIVTTQTPQVRHMIPNTQTVRLAASGSGSATPA